MTFYHFKITCSLHKVWKEKKNTASRYFNIFILRQKHSWRIIDVCLKNWWGPNASWGQLIWLNFLRKKDLSLPIHSVSASKIKGQKNVLWKISKKNTTTFGKMQVKYLLNSDLREVKSSKFSHQKWKFPASCESI